MTETKVNDYERKKPNGGTTHVKSYWRHQEGASSTSPEGTNFEDKEQEEEEKELQDQHGAEGTAEGETKEE